MPKDVNFGCLNDYIVIRIESAVLETDGGILLPETAAGDPQQKATVVTVGPGRPVALQAAVARCEIDVKPGDQVLVDFRAIQPLPKWVGEKLFLCREGDIKLKLGAC